MNKTTKKIILGLIFFIFVSGTFFLLNFYLKNVKDSSKEFSAVENSLSKNEKIIPETYKKLVCVNVKNVSGEFEIRVEKSDNDADNYFILKKDGKVIDDSIIEKLKVKSFIEEILELTPIKTLENCSNDLSKYGLDQSNSKAIIELTFDENKTKKLVLGNEAPLSVGYYLKDIDFEDKVYLITQHSSELFFYKLENYLVNGKDT